MTGFVILALTAAVISIALEIGHRRHLDPTGGPTRSTDADRRRLVAELRAVAQRQPIGPRTRSAQEAVSVRTKASSAA